jgi:hypothetical protein
MFEKSLDPAQRGVITDLNNVPPALMKELRQAGSELEAHRLLMHYGAPATLDYARAFIMEVLESEWAVPWSTPDIRLDG